MTPSTHCDRKGEGKPPLHFPARLRAFIPLSEGQAAALPPDYVPHGSVRLQSRSHGRQQSTVVSWES